MRPHRSVALAFALSLTSLPKALAQDGELVGFSKNGRFVAFCEMGRDFDEPWAIMHFMDVKRSVEVAPPIRVDLPSGQDTDAYERVERLSARLFKRFGIIPDLGEEIPQGSSEGPFGADWEVHVSSVPAASTSSTCFGQGYSEVVSVYIDHPYEEEQVELHRDEAPPPERLCARRYAKHRVFFHRSSILVVVGYEVPVEGGWSNRWFMGATTILRPIECRRAPRGDRRTNCEARFGRTKTTTTAAKKDRP